MAELDLDCTLLSIITTAKGENVLGIYVKIGWNPQYFADIPDGKGRFITEKIHYKDSPPFPTFHDPGNPQKPDRPNTDYREPDPARGAAAGSLDDRNYVPLLAIATPPTAEGDFVVEQKLQYGPSFRISSNDWTTFAEYDIHYSVKQSGGEWVYEVRRTGPTPDIYARWKYDANSGQWKLADHSPITGS